MIKSMTAFGRAKAEGEGKVLTVEMKSVNSRYFDCSVKLPRAYLPLEERIKGYVQTHATSRAKVDVYINVDSHGAEAGSVSVNEAYAGAYIAALRALRDRFDLKDDISVMTVARNPDVFSAEKPEEDVEALWQSLVPALDEAIRGYDAMRTKEGARAIADLFGKIDGIRAMVREIEEISKTDTVGYRDKLEARLRQILDAQDVAIDENRLLTECALFADKIAIDEEIVRLRSHFDAFREIAELPEPSGKKLDFLMQEMNRETNTIGSKANNARIARIVVNIKGELEKIREQVQNFE